MFLPLLCRCVCVNCCSGRRRSCAVHSGIKASSSPTFSLKIKSTPLSCVSTMHTASRRTLPTHFKHHSPWTCRECSSVSATMYRQHGQEPTATTTNEVGRVMLAGQSRLYDGCGCGCGEDSESGCRLLPDEVYTSRMKLRQSESLSRSSAQQQRTGSTSPSRTALLLGTD